MTTETQTLQLDQIRIDGGTQPRVAINQDYVLEYAEEIRDGVQYDPITVFFDGSDFWLADGFHRYFAHRRNDAQVIQAIVHEGTQRDAILFSVGANAKHGHRRSSDDKRKAVLTLLEDSEWSSWSAREIARRCRISESYVRQIKSEHTAHCAQYEMDERTFIHPRTGKPSKMKTGNIGRASKSKSKNPKTPRFGKNAYRPKACHSENGPVPMRAISLPLKNPIQAARSMISIYGEDYMRQVTTELNQIFQSQKGLSNDCTAHEPHGTADSDHLHERHTGHCKPVA